MITPTHARRASRCLHAWFLELRGPEDEKVAPDAGQQRQMDAGLAREKEVVATLEVENADGDASTTRELMRRGAAWIYQAGLEREDVRGVPDLLERIDEPSALGEHSYRAIDIKNHKRVSRGDRTELALYGWLLEPLLGRVPAYGGIWLNSRLDTRAIQFVDTEDALPLIEKMRSVREGARTTTPLRNPECYRCPWIEHCRDQWRAERSISLLYHGSGRNAQALAAAGLVDYADVAHMSAWILAHKTGIRAESAKQIVASARSFVAGEPQRKRLRLWKPRIPRFVHFYDIETYDGVVYLHGVLTRERSGKTRLKQFWGEPHDEGALWKQFLRYADELERGRIYAWSGYEERMTRGLFEKYGGETRAWRRFRRRLTDHCSHVRDRWALPSTSYSLKDVAPLFGFEWTAEDAGGLSSEAWYEQWLKTKDASLLGKVKQYNEEDVRAMQVIFEHLR